MDYTTTNKNRVTLLSAARPKNEKVINCKTTAMLWTSLPEETTHWGQNFISRLVHAKGVVEAHKLLALRTHS